MEAHDPTVYIAVDLDEMRFIARGGMKQLAEFTYLEFPPTKGIGIFDSAYRKGYSRFSEMELKMLYRNTTGYEVASQNYNALVQTCFDLGLKVAVCPIPVERLLLMEPTKWNPDDYPNQPVVRRGTSVVGYQPSGSATAGSKVKRQAATPGEIKRPKTGSATGRVWDIADQLAQTSMPSDDAAWKSFKAKVVATCVEQGINAATAQVQFGKWKASK